jgi:hypothetical protein
VRIGIFTDIKSAFSPPKCPSIGKNPIFDRVEIIS